MPNPPTREEIDGRLLRALEEIERHEKRRATEKVTEARGIDHVLREVQGLRGEVKDEIRHVREDIRGVQARVSILENARGLLARENLNSTPPGRYAAPGSFELDIPVSKSGSIREEDMKRAWAELLVKIDAEVQQLRSEADDREKLARLAKKQAEEQLKAAEESRKKWWFRIKVAGAVAGPLLPVVGYVLGKLFHL